MSPDYRAQRCGHNYPPTECRSPVCGYRDALATITTLEAELARVREELRCERLLSECQTKCAETILAAFGS